MSTLSQYLQDNKQRQLDELIELLRIPSVSARAEQNDDVKRCCQSISDHLRQAGAENVQIFQTAGHPIVYGDLIRDPKKPTVLVYGHYDVQPTDPDNLWDSPPFEPIIKKTALHPEGAIFARGACDDKGQLFMHLKAFEAMVATNTMPCNVKFMLEGEEEVGSTNLYPFTREHLELLACDVVLISDTGIIANNIPSVTVGLRGLAYMEVEVTGPNRDLHSGIYGGAVANPINILCDMISSLHDKKRRVTVKGFYDDVKKETAAYRKKLNLRPFSIEDYKKSIGIPETLGEAGYTTIETTGIRPTLELNGIWGGYTGEGAKTVLPSKAHAKISMRLVPNQSSEKIAELFQAHFEAIAPKNVHVKVTFLHGGEAAVTPIDTVEYKAAHLAYKATFGVDPIPTRDGGSIPIVALFKEVLGVDTILLGFGLDSDAIHSPNEHYGLFNFYRGIETIPHFFKNYAALK
jgi:acetylornithine deacetylase/succinyl-diaminopimelate desuccinylase-like protein